MNEDPRRGELRLVGEAVRVKPDQTLYDPFTNPSWRTRLRSRVARSMTPTVCPGEPKPYVTFNQIATSSETWMSGTFDDEGLTALASDVQIEEMYSVPESFLEIEVRNPQTHGASLYLWLVDVLSPAPIIPLTTCRLRTQNVHRLRDRLQSETCYAVSDEYTSC